MTDKVKVRIGGQLSVKYSGVVEMDRSLYEQLSQDWENQKDGVDEDILLDFADALRNGYVDDPEVDEFEIDPSA